MRRLPLLAGMMLGLLAGQTGGSGPAFPSPSPSRGQVRAHPVEASGAGATQGGVARYTVRTGDNLTRVASRLGVSVATLAAANQIADPNRLRAGQVLTIPRVGEPEPAAAATLAPLSSAVVVVGGGSRHRVAAGENLARIAARYGSTTAELAASNGLKDPNLIREGAELQVPGAPWICPVQGPRQFSDSWGAPRPGGRRHLGVDVFATRGTPVVASVGGVLSHAKGATAGLAYYLQGEDRNTYYGAHLDALEAPGRVEAGARIGTVGSTGNARGTTPHLHFEIKPAGGAPVNPMPSFEKWCRS
ncbi:MAG TPA: M23 family metallopeptidase [Acidimicrobiales bacterium]|nr:M23 family metallopeptidase [Acidimicrobiales bacterium]